MPRPLTLTIDLGVQEVVRSEVAAAVDRFKAKGGTGLVLDVATGEIVGMVSLPDFDPNHYQRATVAERFNRNSQGSYELGSLFKVFTVAMALDAGVVDMSDGYDASRRFEIGRYRIDDYRAHRRWLSVPEVMAFSSNIGAARMADAMGGEAQRAYFERFGLLEQHPIGLPEVGTPMVPDPWRPINTVTAAYGHGIAVSPLQAVDAVAGAICGEPLPRAHLVAEGPLPGARRAAGVGRDRRQAALADVADGRKGHRRRRRRCRATWSAARRAAPTRRAAAAIVAAASWHRSSPPFRSTGRATSCWSPSTSRKAMPGPTATAPAAGPRRRPPAGSSAGSARCSGCRRPIRTPSCGSAAG